MCNGAIPAGAAQASRTLHPASMRPPSQANGLTISGRPHHPPPPSYRHRYKHPLLSDRPALFARYLPAAAPPPPTAHRGRLSCHPHSTPCMQHSPPCPSRQLDCLLCLFSCLLCRRRLLRRHFIRHCLLRRRLRSSCLVLRRLRRSRPVLRRLLCRRPLCLCSPILPLAERKQGRQEGREGRLPRC